jgi:hypothetical protein
MSRLILHTICLLVAKLCSCKTQATTEFYSGKQPAAVGVAKCVMGLLWLEATAQQLMRLLGRIRFISEEYPLNVMETQTLLIVSVSINNYRILNKIICAT